MKRLLPILPARLRVITAMMLLVSCASESQAYNPQHQTHQNEEDEEYPVLEAVQKVLAVPTYPILLFFEMLKGMKPV